MGRLIEEMDWAETDLGPISSWSPTLKTIVRFLLANRFPLLLWWGPDFLQIYNDAYRPILGTKHPTYLGRPVRECWSEIWHILKPLIETPFQGGPPTWMEDILLEINRYGYFEESHFTIAYSPVPDETVPGGIGGVLATVHEISEKVVAERRILVLRDLGAGSLDAKSGEAACGLAAETLAQHSKDIPFALLYLIDQDRKHANLAGVAGVAAETQMSPLSIDLANDPLWDLKTVLEKQNLHIVRDLGERFHEAVPKGPWGDPPKEAVIAPIRSSIPHQLAGFLIAGISSRLRFDDSYRNFLELVTSQIATGIANARAFEEEKRRAEALAELDRVKTMFFSNVSHEFRTPLTLMLGPIEDSLEDPLPEITRERLTVAHRNSLRLLKLVNNLLDFSRIEAGRIQAFYEPVDLSALTTDLASVFRSAIETAGIKLRTECPPLEQPVYVDREMWEKIVFNLISNAFKFTFEGSIEVILHGTETAAEFIVRDSGTGIPDEELPRIFDRFHRIENARGRTYEGSGIGLSLVQELVKLHGGTVQVKSKLDQGSEFKITIPFGHSHLPKDHLGIPGSQVVTASKANVYVEELMHWLPGNSPVTSEGLVSPAFTPSPGQGAKGLRILVADDNADMRQYLYHLLSPNYQITEAADGESALELAQRLIPDLILTDVMMPKLDGFGFLKALRSDHRTSTIPVILLSARAGEEARIEGMHAGADDYLVKPFSAKELLARIEGALKLHQVRLSARESETRFRELADNMDQLAWTANELGTATWYNHRWYDYTGTNFEQMKNRGWESLHHPDLIESVNAKLQKALASGEAWEDTFLLRGKDGEYRWFLSRAIPIRNEQGKIVRWFGTNTDVDERKRHSLNAEFVAQLNEHLARLSDEREIMRVAAEKICNHLGAWRCQFTEIDPVKDTATVLYDWSKQSKVSLSGLYRLSDFVTPESHELLSNGKQWVVPDAMVDTCPARIQDRLAKMEIAAFIDTPFLSDGTWKASLTVLHHQSRRWRNEEIELLRDLCVRIWPRIDRTRAERAVRIKTAQFETLINQAPLGVYLVDSDFRIRQVNPTALPSFGNIPNLIGKDFEEVIHILWDRNYADEIVRLFRHTLETGESYETPERIEYRIDRKITEFYEWRIDRITLPEGGYGVVCYFRDISDQVKARDAIAESKIKLQQALEASQNASRIKDELLATVSHELRTPLNAILGWAHMLQSRGLDAGITESAISAIYTSAKAQAQLIDDLLDVARISAGKMNLECKNIVLQDVLSKALSTLSHAIRAKKLQVHLADFSESQHVELYADPQRLQQIFWNLLSNAVKFTSEGGGIHITISRAKSDVMMEFRDTGVGIVKEFLPFVFEPFRQMDGSTSRKFGGLGLGMSISKNLVELHGGTISVQSEGIGLGTAFKIQMPLLQLELQEPSKSTAHRPKASMYDVNLSEMRILIVDDDPQTLQLMTEAFNQSGAVIRISESATKAYDILKEWIPDLLISDIAMPEKDGYWLIEQIRAIPELARVRTIALTAYSTALDRANALTAGFDMFVAKPIEPSELLNTAKTLLQKPSAIKSSSRPQARSVGASELFGKKILLVEDDLLSVEALRLALENEGSNIRATFKAAEALATLQDWIPDIIISDLGLPDEDGYSLIKKIHALPALFGLPIPAVALTGYGKEEGERALAAGFDVYKSKPVDPDTLISLLKEIIRKNSLENPPQRSAGVPPAVRGLKPANSDAG